MCPSIDAGAVLDDIDALIDRADDLPAVAEVVLIETVKALAATVPMSRYDPFYGIDRGGGPSLAVLERLSRHGDFRKYVHVLDVRAGLGGGARWLAARYGCRVVALDHRPSLVVLANRLSRRAGVGDRVRALGGTLAAVPARDGVFTQIWCVEALHRCDDVAHALSELFRVLRPGSPIALQEIVAAGDSPAEGSDAALTAAAYCEALATAGFSTIDHEDVTALRPETSSLVLSARARFERALRARVPDLPRRRGDGEPAIVDAATRADRRVVQLFARRPST